MESWWQYRMDSILEFYLENGHLCYIATNNNSIAKTRNLTGFRITGDHLFLEYEEKEGGCVMADKVVDLGRIIGTTFIPTVASDGTITWTNDGNLANPSAVTIKGATGAQGPQGAAGATGATGKGIKTIATNFLTNATASGVTTATSGWSTTPTATTTTNKYMWAYETITYTDNSTATTTTRIITTHGATGATGATGPQGPTGETGANGLTPVLSTSAEGHLIATYTSDISGL